MVKRFKIWFPTMVVVEVIVGISIAFFVMFLWLIMTPVTLALVNNVKQVAQDMGHYNSFLSQGITILSYILYFWGPCLVIAIMFIWIYAASGKIDPRSVY